jgi:hypothetical protein
MTKPGSFSGTAAAGADASCAGASCAGASPAVSVATKHDVQNEVFFVIATSSAKYIHTSIPMIAQEIASDLGVWWYEPSSSATRQHVLAQQHLTTMTAKLKQRHPAQNW